MDDVNSLSNGRTKEQSNHGLTIKQLFCNSSFWLLMVVMVCGGASELSISQWALAFAEAGLNVDKTIGDLLDHVVLH